MTDPSNLSLSVRRRYVCPSCDFQHEKWSPRCLNPVCSSTKGLEARIVEAPPEQLFSPADGEVPVPQDEGGPIALSEVKVFERPRDLTNIEPLDRVLGGGIVVASAIVISAAPGTGKSRLTLQLLNNIGHRCLYATGEETVEQIAMTAQQIGAVSSKVFVVAETDIDKIIAYAKTFRARTIAIDSIQKMKCSALESQPGTVPQVKTSTNQLVAYCRATGTSLWIIGQVAGDGSIAGPRALEHDVDVILDLEHGRHPDGTERLLRCSKNRFGPTNEVGCFTMTAEGLVPNKDGPWRGGDEQAALPDRRELFLTDGVDTEAERPERKPRPPAVSVRRVQRTAEHDKISDPFGATRAAMADDENRQPLPDNED